MIPVLYIVGAGRSGSTILAHLLGEIDGYISVGELRNLWISAIIQRSLCSCGRAVDDCKFWGPIVAELDLDDRERAEATWAWQRRHLSATRPANLLAARPRSKRRREPRFEAYVNQLGRLYAAVVAHSGARVVVDSSKGPVDAGVLAAVPNVAPYYVFLVRDPRAVVYSWARKKEADPAGTRAFSRRGLSSAVATWVVHNLESEAVGRLQPGRPWLSLRYEDFVAQPDESIAAIRRMVEGNGVVSTSLGTGVELHTQHSLGGNPVKFSTGKVEIRSDDEWRTKLSAGRRRVVTAATFPLLRRYGY
jgi:hypothetical protein